MKLADMPSCLEGGGSGINLLANHSVEVRILLLQQIKSSFVKAKEDFSFNKVQACL